MKNITAHTLTSNPDTWPRKYERLLVNQLKYNDGWDSVERDAHCLDDSSGRYDFDMRIERKEKVLYIYQSDLNKALGLKE